MFRYFIFCVFLLCLMAIVGLTVARAQNVTTSVQGVLRDPQGRSVDDGTYELTFKLYTQATGGSAMWEEIQSNVSVSHGVFSVKLGAVNPISGLSASQTYYLGVTAPGAGELLPRVELTKTFAANTAGSVTGASNVVPSEGNVGIGTLTPVSKLEVVGDVKISSGGKLYFPDNTFLASAQSGTAEQVTSVGNANIIADNDNNGSGEILMKTGNLERMRVRENGNVGIGTTNPGSKLHVEGNIIGDGFYDLNPAYYADMSSGGNLGGNWTIGGALRAGAPSGDAFIIGDDAKLVDVNQANAFAIYGLSDNTTGGIKLGSAGPTLMGNNGNLGIGTTSPTSKLDINSDNDPRMRFRINNSALGFTIGYNVGANEAYLWNEWNTRMVFGTNGSLRMYITPEGGIYRHDGGAFWNNFSDKRMKKDISSYNGGLELIKQLNPVKFKYNGKGGISDDGKEHVGFIAQDIEQIPELAPLMVTKEKMKLEETDAETTDLLSLNTSALQFILVNAIKEQQKQIEELKAELQELKKK